MQHSNIVGGSTAKRVMACPASVGLAAKMPPQPASSYANEGTLLHEAAATLLGAGPSLVVITAGTEGSWIHARDRRSFHQPAYLMPTVVDTNSQYDTSTTGSTTDYYLKTANVKTADNGNGTYTNPLFYDEFSDPDVFRVGDDFYLTGTTMHSSASSAARCRSRSPRWPSRSWSPRSSPRRSSSSSRSARRSAA